MKRVFFQVVLIALMQLAVRDVHGAINESDVKAALVAKFTEFVSWPGNPQPLVIGYLGDDEALWLSLDKLANKSSRQQQFSLNRLRSINDIHSPHILVVASSHNNDVARINRKISQSPTLLITEDLVDQTQIGINFTTTEQNTISFNLNRYNLVYQGLSVNQQIVLLGGSEIDVATMVREMALRLSESSDLIAKLNQRVQQLDESVAQRQSALNNKERLLTEKNQQLQQINKDFDKASSKLLQLETTVGDLNQALNHERQQLDETALLLGDKRQELERKQSELAQISIDKTALTEQIEANQTLIEQQQSVLAELEQTVVESTTALDVQSDLLERQSTALVLAIVGLLMIASFAALLWRLAKRKQVMNRLLEQKNAQLAEVNTELLTAQQQLVEAQKMASLAKLVAGIAHEINTPLGVAITATTYLSQTTEKLLKDFQSNALKRSSLQASLDGQLSAAEMATNSLNRAAELVNTFKQVSLAQIKETPKQFALLPFIEQTVKQFHREFKQQRVAVKVCCDTNDIELVSYPGLLSQVLTSLASNSAIHGFEQTQDPEITISVSSDDLGVHIHYADNGSGIAQEIHGEIFEPFFTTNRQAGSTGLGLHICFNLVTHKMQGTINCLSSDQGALFAIHLPHTISESQELPAQTAN
ncbi:DUF4154 domain-containing protein [Neiella sp. HB171785]|uniref:histidine kinase n=1 Tax=Neiella litorisoli TaxID=2771431 RepID=A0A8J6R286_9GAMM|nr:YfiR/HmsC family protein [Neiella litorisoli]MBD1388705.1 DUF4154 domain-containing protein [Neiella litorisoli]